MACGRVRVTYQSIAGLFDFLRRPLVMDFSDSEVVRSAFAALVQEQLAAQPGSELMAVTLMTQCLILLLRRLCGRQDCSLPWLSALEDPRLGRAIGAILDAPGRRHTVDSLAELAGMSRSTFTSHFASAFDRSPMDFVKETRLHRAAQLLKKSDLPIKAVAGRVGFASRSHFSRAFAGYFGRSPADFRRSGAPAS